LPPTGTQRFPQLGDSQWQELRYLQGFPRAEYLFDGKLPEQNTERTFTVTFTIKTIRCEAIDAIGAER
jgi:hypothetical protein